ncbi:MAG: caspase family protein [Oscillochloris sp.]|nr:caspase family protein [Oscillochloris sp.]
MGAFTRGYGLIIGVSEYSDPTWNVPIVARDAHELHATLTDPAAAGYPPNQVELLCGAVNSQTVIKALERLAARARSSDTVCIVFNGHGATTNRNLYTLATSDTVFEDTQHVRQGTGLSISKLAEALKSIQAERLLLVINACFSGYTSILAAKGGLREMPPVAGIPNSQVDTLLATGKGRALISASRADQHSYFQPDDPHTVFGQALIDSLRGVGISQRSGYIGLYELYEQIYQHVHKIAQINGIMQEPVLSLVEGVGPFPVALHSGAQAPEANKIQQTPPASAEVRTVQISIGTQNIDNRKIIDKRKVIDFNNSQIGSVNFHGDIAQRDAIRNYYGKQPGDSAEDKQFDPLHALQKLRRQIETARNVDEDARDDAASKIKQAHRALDKSDRVRAVQRINEALEILDAMNNGYISSAARKLRAVRDALA